MKDIVAKALIILYALALFSLGIYFVFNMASPNLVGAVLSDITGESYFKWIGNIPILYANAIAVCIPVMLISFFSRLRRIRSISSTLERVAIPWSIFISAAGFNSSFSFFGASLPLSIVMATVGSSFFAIFCGGLLATVGYYLREERADADRPLALIDHLTFLAILIFSYLAWLAALQLSPIDLGLPFLFIGSCYVLQWASLKPIWPVDRETMLELLLKSVTPATLGGVLLAIVLWISALNYPEAIGPALYLGLICLMVGSISLAFVAITSEENLHQRQLIWRSSWHLLEIYALLILIVYAPVSGLEMLIQGL